MGSADRNDGVAQRLEGGQRRARSQATSQWRGGDLCKCAEESLGAPLDLAHADFTEEHATSCDGMDSAVQYINREDKRWQHSARLLMGRQYVPN